MFLFKSGDAQYEAEVQDYDYQVVITRTVRTCDEHPEQSVTLHHYLTYPEIVYDINVDYAESIVKIELGNRHEDSYSFTEIECMFTGEGEENEMIEQPDNVNHPAHYKTSSGLEAIDVIDAFTEDLKGYECTYTSQVLKYTLRWKHKNGLEDLEKANWYLTRLINKLKEAQK